VTVPTSVFVSYAYETSSHLSWVRRLADHLEECDEFDVVFDRYDLYGGKDVTHFMERGLNSDRIVVVVTPEYVRKSTVRAGGVGYESSVISASLLVDQLADRFVPVLRSGDERPAFLMSKQYIDFREESQFEESLEQLKMALLRLAPVPRPAKRSSSIEAPEPADIGVQPQIQRPSAKRPLIVPSLVGSIEGMEYYGPIELENIGETDAFNVQLEDVSNGSSAARFAIVARLRPGEKVNARPVIDGARETRNGFANLYDFAWIGQIGHAWDVVTSGRIVPREEIDALVKKTFAAPLDTTYSDIDGARWITRASLTFGQSRVGRMRMFIEMNRVESLQAPA
jgi:TIR domain